MVKEFLSQKGIGFTEHDVSRDRAAAQEMVGRTGQRGVPVTIVDGQTIIGFDRPRLEQALSQLRPTFGAAIADASTITVRQGSGIKHGAYIGKVRPGSVAERSGLRPDDIITELNRQHITNAHDLEEVLASLRKGSRLSLVFTRGNETLSAEGSF